MDKKTLRRMPKRKRRRATHRNKQQRTHGLGGGLVAVERGVRRSPLHRREPRVRRGGRTDQRDGEGQDGRGWRSHGSGLCSARVDLA